MKAHEILKGAADIMEERGKQYDQPGGERSMGRAVASFNAITGRDLREDEGWLLMQQLKKVRLHSNPSKFHEDSAIDGVAYAALEAESWFTRSTTRMVPTEPPPQVSSTQNQASPGFDLS